MLNLVSFAELYDISDKELAEKAAFHLKEFEVYSNLLPRIFRFRKAQKTKRNAIIIYLFIVLKQKIHTNDEISLYAYNEVWEWILETLDS